jgi:hypothetical protein
VSSHAGQEDLPTFKVDEEQHVEPTECDGVHGEEVAGKRAGSLGSKELSPRGSRSSRCWAKTIAPQDVADTRRLDGDAELRAPTMRR